ncbi:hypothetical protein PCE1_000027 [Barthelona sp. PCE]
MVVLSVCLKGEFENIDSVSVNSQICCNTRCQCGAVRQNVWINANEEVDVPNSRGKANIVIKCTACERRSTISNLTFIKGMYKSSEGHVHIIATAECRSCTIDSFSLDDTPFSFHFEEREIEMDNDDGCFFGFDDVTGNPTSVTETSVVIETFRERNLL